MKTTIAWIIRTVGLAVGTVWIGGFALLMLWLAYDALARLGFSGVFHRLWPVALGVVGVACAVAAFTWASDHLGRD